MFGDCKDDGQLREAWEGFCDELKDAGELVFRDTAPNMPLDKIKGLRLLLRNITLASQFNFENIDPKFPELMRYFDPLRKQGGDNTDALYVGSPVNGADTYHIVGHRGQSRYFAITVLEDGDTPWGGGVTGSLLGSQLTVEPDGSFEVILSPDEHPGNWIKTGPGAWRVTIRQFFADWENEEPMTARIDRIGKFEAKPEPTTEQFARGLKDTVDWLRVSTTYWADMIDMWKAKPNQFMSYRDLDDNAIDATPGGEPLICYWKVKLDEALVVRVTPPDADYWAVETGHYWWETMDYRYRQCSTNCHHAELEDDGSLILVLSHDDSGYPNWIDPSEHLEGYITFRWIGSDHYPVPQCQQVTRSELDSAVSGAKRISYEERQKLMVGRRLGVNKRFRA